MGRICLSPPLPLPCSILGDAASLLDLWCRSRLGTALLWVADLNPVAQAFLWEDSWFCLLQPWSRSLLPVPPDPTFPAASGSPAACSALPLPPSRSPVACGRMRALPQDMNHVSMELLLHPLSSCLPRRGAALPPVSTAGPQGARSQVAKLCAPLCALLLQAGAGEPATLISSAASGDDASPPQSTGALKYENLQFYRNRNERC